MFSWLSRNYIRLTANNSYLPIDTLFIYLIRFYRLLFQRDSLQRYATVKVNNGQKLPRAVSDCLNELLREPWRVMDERWRLTLANGQGRNFILYAIIRATTGNVLELGRDRGRTMAIGLEAFHADQAHRHFVSIDPVKLDLLDSDFCSPMCAGYSYGVNLAEDQRDLPDGYRSVFIDKRDQIKAVVGFSYEKEVLEYVSHFGPFDVILFDAYWAEDSDTYNAIKRDFSLYAPLLRSGGYLLISNAFDLRFEIHRFITEIISRENPSCADFILIRIDLPGLFKDKNSCLLKKM